MQEVFRQKLATIKQLKAVVKQLTAEISHKF